MDRFVDIKKRLIQYAENDADMKAVISIGSSARAEVKADEYSDLDLIIVSDNVDVWYSGEYPNRLGHVTISFIEPTLGGGRERRCIFDEDRDVDMIIFTPEQFETALKEGVAAWVMNRGYQILYDNNSYEEMIVKYVTPGHSNPQITEEEFYNLVNDFYFHNIWAAKKLLRGELWSAKMCVDAYLKNILLKAVELYCYDRNKVDVWHDGRFLDRWAEDSIKHELKNCFAHYDKADVVLALQATNRLFERVTREIAEKRGYSYPHEAAVCAKNYLIDLTM
ncbi:MAG: aminoglycoside 6-adenylyltransferase [Lachnospiraceae bacterium]|nr:aminoglycoside 6-adenylyltransferase [Lachnospiraceae bacterium]